MRIVYNNAADRGTLTASSTAITAQNLLTEDKSEVYRSASGVTTMSFTITWASTETAGFVGLPFCNLSPTATMQVRCYSDTGTTLVYNTMPQLCAQGAAPQLFGLSAAQSSSAYAYGGGVCAGLWIPATNVRKLVIDIVDTANLQGYIEAARLVIGNYFTTKYGAEYGAEISMEDNSVNTRSDSGSLKSDIGCRYKKLTLSLPVLTPEDRAALWKLVSYCGIVAPVFVSVFPENEDKDLEQAYSVYGKFSSVSVMSASSYEIYSAPLEVEGL